MNADEVYQYIECQQHGRQQATYLCKHLVESLRTGAYVGYWCADEPKNPRPDAWCTTCEDKVQSTGGEWTDESESFAGVTLLCGACYDKAKKQNID